MAVELCETAVVEDIIFVEEPETEVDITEVMTAGGTAVELSTGARVVAVELSRVARVARVVAVELSAAEEVELELELLLELPGV